MELLFRSADVLENAIEAAVAGADAVDVGAGGRAAPAPTGGATPTAAAAAARKRASRCRQGRARDRRRADGRRRRPPATGLLVRVRLAAGTPLTGVRAFLVVQAARALGEVVATVPSARGDAGGRDGARLRPAARHGARPGRGRGGAARAPATSSRCRSATSRSTRAPSAAPRGRAGRAGARHDRRGAAPRRRRSNGKACAQQRSVRIDLRRLDNLMNLIGELVITRGRLVAALGRARRHGARGDGGADVAARGGSAGRDHDEPHGAGVAGVRPLPAPRARRGALGAASRWTSSIEGKEVELDRSMLDEVGRSDRPPAAQRGRSRHRDARACARRRASRAAGRLTLSATARSLGRRHPRDATTARGSTGTACCGARRRAGWWSAGKTELSDDELFRIISRPGFSTAETVTDLSGRGVGIDAVYNRVRTLGGSVDMRTRAGRGHDGHDAAAAHARDRALAAGAGRRRDVRRADDARERDGGAGAGHPPLGEGARRC